METEASAIARKIQSYIVIENDMDLEIEATAENKAEPGIFKNLLLITLMGAAVVFTQITCTLVAWVRKLESN